MATHNSGWRHDAILIDFLLLQLPGEIERKEGFMDIADIQYHENTISRIYAYFLNTRKNAAVASLFLSSLLQLVKIKCGKELEFDNHLCLIERQTDKGNRIDLLIKSGNDDFKAEDSALVIENKIFSSIGNDLLDYWTTIKLDNDKKVGVLLTLTPANIPESVKDYFINITHREWLTEVKLNGLPYGLEPNYYIYINDFIRNMENIVKSTEGLSEDASFYFEHSAKVLRAMQTYDAARGHVINQLKILGEKLGLGIYGNSGGWRHIWDYKSHVYYAIGFDDVLKPDPKITVFLEVYKDGIPRRNELCSALKDLGYYNHLIDDNKYNQSWAHLAYKEYELSKSPMEHLADYLFVQIRQDFHGAYEVVQKRLHN